MLKDVAIAGATGLVGRALADQLAANPRGGALHLLLRRPQPGLQALPRATAITWQGIGTMPSLPAIDTGLCALGTTIRSAGSEAAFRAVDFDAVVAFAQACRRSGATHFGLVSALGADARSGIFYNRVKGEAEEAVAALGFERLVIARPSLLLGDRQALGQPQRPGEAAAQALAPMIGWMIPRRLRPIPAEWVAAGLIEALRRPGARLQHVESDELTRLGSQTARQA